MFPYPAAMQRSFDDMGTPLCDVTFVVLDLETTGGSPTACAITEVGAIKLRGGECLGTFQTLVNPGEAIPPEITYLTGITEAMVLPAPPIERVLPAFLEFIGGGVIVGHNVRFDISFLQMAARRLGYARLDQRFVDTCSLARRLVRDEVPNCKLGTLADHFRTAVRPTHRALDDAKATAELLHCLLERAGSLGVLALDDLLELPTVKGHPQLSKLSLVSRLPRSPGVYLFRDRNGRVIYVGKAINLRRRVRSYFTGDERRKIGQLLREVDTIDHIVCRGELEAGVLEVRLIHELSPRFNRQAKLWRKYAYVKVTLDERFPRLSIVREPKDDGCIYVGPLGSTSAARLVADAIETASAIRRCTKRPGRTLKPAPCAPAQLGVAVCPCAGAVSDAEYKVIIDHVVRGLTEDPRLLLAPLQRRMHELATARRFEEAASVRDRAAALSRALNQQRRIEALRRAGRVTVEAGEEGTILLDGGRLLDLNGQLDFHPACSGPVPKQMADELRWVAAWLDRRAAQLRVVDCDGGLSSPLPRLPRFEPAGTGSRRD
jgi:DNA polymerase III subunit epsilon